MRNIKRIVDLLEPDHTVLPQLFAFRELMAACLLYSSDESADLEITAHTERSFAEIKTLMSNEFYDLLYVDRNIESEIKSLAKSEKLLLLKGHAGTGKTTVLQKIYRDLRTHNDKAIYINLPIYFEQIKQSHSPETTVCAILYEQIILNILNKSTDPEIRNRWRIYRFHNHPMYQRLRMSISDNERHLPQTDEEWLELFDSPYHKHARLAIEQSRENVNDTQDLITVLGFLKEYFGKPCLIVLDNIDRYPLKFQRQVIDKAIDLSHIKILNGIVAVRYANYERLFEPTRADEVILVKKVNLRELSVGDETVAAILHKRLNFISSSNIKEIIGVPDLNYLISKLNFSSHSEYIKLHSELFHLIRNEFSGRELSSALGAWYNFNLRAISAHLFNLLNGIITEADPLFKYHKKIRSIMKDAHKRARPGLLDGRSIRTLCYRYIIFGNKRPPSDPEIVNIFRRRESASRSRHVYFLPLKILKYLEQYECVKYGDMVSAFGQIDVDKEMIFEELKVLKKRKRGDTRGLINIDLSDRRIRKDMDSNTEIEITDAGRFFTGVISVSCEYLFWMALYTDVPNALIPKETSLDQLEDDSFRANVAAQFLRVYVMPKIQLELLDEDKGLLTNDFTKDDLYKMFTLSDDMGGLYAERAARGVMSFLGQSSISVDQTKPIVIKMEKLRRECLAIRRQISTTCTTSSS